MPANLESLIAAPEIVVALDLDGTLVPFAPTPQEAVVDGEPAELLAALSALPGVTVAVVTGRPHELVADLPPRFPNILFAAEHGVWRYAGTAWAAALQPVATLTEIETSLRHLAERHPGARVERKSASVCIHWRMVDPSVHDAVAAAAEVIVDEWLETHPGLERLPVIEALEIRHRLAHKGTAISWLRTITPANAPMLAIGDDVTDEDMFTSLREKDVGVLVCDKPRRTQAQLRVGSPIGVYQFLRWLIDARKNHHAEPAPPSIADPITARQLAATTGGRLVVASNRLPSAPTGNRMREVGGLVSALVPALTEHGGLWLGWSGAERDPGLRLRVEDVEPFARAQFDYPVGWREKFYVGFCNQSLWPLLHAFPGRARYDDTEWATYGEANVAYARLTLQAGGPSSTVWVQDFHLLLLARELRTLGHTGKLGFYLHVPWPPLDVIETLPWAPEIMRALGEFDSIGLQCTRWRDNFMHAAQELLGSEAVAKFGPKVHVIPVGTDPDRFAEDAATTTESPELGNFSQMLGGRQLILGVDRLDYSKGVPERLEAYARFLEKYPAWRGKVVFVQVSVPTRSEVPEYAELRSRVELLVGRINGAYGEADWVPVRYLYRSYDQATLARLYRAAAVALVTPLRDGMNLVAKEYVASQDAANPGVLVLSRFCGAAERLPTAVLTNPYYLDGVAADLDTALRMPLADRVAAHAAQRASVWADTASAWATNFLGSLAE